MESPSPEHVKIDSIKINVNGFVMELKIDQARSLWSQLDEIFGPKPAAPIWIEPYRFGYASPPYSPYFGDPPHLGPTCGGGSIMCNPNTEPFPEKWGIVRNVYEGNSLIING